MDHLNKLLEIVEDLLKILVLILTARELIKKDKNGSKSKNKKRRK